ncbi:MAG: nuclear transport factor 2 family protein [Acidobacteria bacterium]|nr:nuclear transport factor 2 family protein [Acidobacteriota bacterium]
MKRIATCLAALILFATALYAQKASDANEVWSLEEAYWKYVQTNDLDSYRTLWHADFLGWPLSSPEPTRKAQITDWVTAHTSKGERLKSYEVERLTTQVTGEYATTTYRVRLTWADKTSVGNPGSLRIIHTWLRNPYGKWQIISGMSAPTNADGH